MKKVIFISALAIAAAASCTKSDIVDTKFNDAIGFETYLGRDAQTKASVATNFSTAGIYGFYTGSQQWALNGETGDAYVASPKANLWVNDILAFAGTVDPIKYWANADDYYSFLAYAPKGDGNISNFPTGKDEDNNNVDVTNPTITFAVPTALASQTDLLYANVLNTKKPATTGDKVAMSFHHALARLTVNAKAAANQKFGFCIKKITIAGGFHKSDVLTLKDGSWAKAGEPVEATKDEKGNDVPAETYTFYNESANTTALGTSNTDYAKVGDAYSNYLMMIPVDFTDAPATLTVEYTTVYDNVESTVITKTFDVTTNFEQGNAYAINLTFSKDVEAIEFTVSVEDWKPTTTVDGVPQLMRLVRMRM